MGVSRGTPDSQTPLTLTIHSLKSEDRRMAWHKGSWWPLFVKEWYAPKSSQHMFDPYSFCLIVLGLVFHLLWGTDDIDYWAYGFLAALVIELVLEVVGNSQFVLKRIRSNSGTSGEYIGDSVQNIIGDIFSVGLGYILGTLFLALEMWWLSILWAALSEMICVLYMRDSLLMTITTILVHSDKLRTWQLAKLPKCESPQGWFISRLFGSNSAPKKTN